MEAKPQGLKPARFCRRYGTAEAVPFHEPRASRARFISRTSRFARQIHFNNLALCAPDYVSTTSRFAPDFLAFARQIFLRLRGRLFLLAFPADYLHPAHCHVTY